MTAIDLPHARLPRIAVLGAGHVGPVIARVAIEAGDQADKAGGAGKQAQRYRQRHDIAARRHGIDARRLAAVRKAPAVHGGAEAGEIHEVRHPGPHGQAQLIVVSALEAAERERTARRPR